MRVEYEWKPARCSSCKIYGHILNECPKKRVSDVVLNSPRQATRGATVGPNVSFKLTKQIYRPISNKNDVSARCKKKQAEVSREKVSNSNLFDALNYVEDDDELGTNGRNSKNMLVPMSNVDSESEVELVFRESANLMASMCFKGRSGRGYDTNSLLEQWRKTKRNDDYDPYDDDLYESHDMSNHLQAICDELDITVHGRIDYFLCLFSQL
uniref:Zinc knuckle CX2CX4HX4C n=1 Tax=Tanacetum cinerariifolium TaxID=118510 RepID=A0A6L2JVA9_TANCI|nr:hypothetical protein [Tanacetum cinerariifolium]